MAIQTEDADYADVPLALEHKVEALMRRRLSSLLGIKQYVSADHYAASSNTTQPRLAAGGEDQHRLLLEQQNSSSYVSWNKAPALVGNVPNVRRMSIFMPVLAGKKRDSALGTTE